MLEQFTPAQSQAQARASSSAASPIPPASSGTPSASKDQSKAKSNVPPPPASLDDLDISADFARELAEGMANLMREIAAESEAEGLEKGKASEPTSEAEREREEAFRRAWEAMLVESMNGQVPPESIGREMAASKEKGKGKDGILMLSVSSSPLFPLLRVLFDSELVGTYPYMFGCTE